MASYSSSSAELEYPASSWTSSGISATAGVDVTTFDTYTNQALSTPSSEPSTFDTHTSTNRYTPPVSEVRRFDQHTPTAREADHPTPFPPAVFIPSAWFRKVKGKVVDVDGNPITRAKYIHAVDIFPTSAEVDDNGEFEIRLLQRAYSNWILTAESDRSGVDYAWYQPVDTYVGNREDEAELVFKVSEIKGNYAGGGVDMGGMLG